MTRGDTSVAVFGNVDVPGPLYLPQNRPLIGFPADEVIVGADWTCTRCDARLRSVGNGRALPEGWVSVTRNIGAGVSTVTSVLRPPASNWHTLCPDCDAVLHDFMLGVGPS